jgi:hypothetical protein
MAAVLIGVDPLTQAEVIHATTKPIDSHRASDMLGSYELCHSRFDDGNVLLRRSPADSDAGDHLTLTGVRHASAHRGVPTARDGEERIERRAWLHEGDEVSGAYADEGRRVGLFARRARGRMRALRSCGG